ncbi:tRNA(Ile)-lysidine synthase [Marmoricola sp. OAE513]|uniref:tRNA lysidine(34) synthetase TilS n=1 Tax=Marmoricola sp. OAE513 TaxID=2817894 RepID=UPI001AE44C63
MTLDPAVAAVRSAVRRCLGDARTVLVACSGGADSLALLAAAVFETRREESVRVIGVTVDHGLQAGSSEHAASVVAQMAELGADETATIRVTVDPGPGGIEAGAREARYAALGQLAEHFGAEVVLLGHTRDDQAETVLLGLARGSGGRSLAGMRPGFDLDGIAVLRPLLGVTRAQTEAACTAEGITWWDDPHNSDHGFARVRVRQTVLPTLENELGPGVAAALARTAAQLQADTDFLDSYAEMELASSDFAAGLSIAELRRLPTAIATRVVRRLLIEAGAIASELTYEHVLAVLAVEPGKEIQLPGHLTAYRDRDLLQFRPTITPP